MSASKSLADIFDEFESLEPTHERENYIRAPFGWPGGKSRSLKHIIPVLQKVNNQKTFVGCCGGSGVVEWNVGGTFQLRVFNDRHAGLVAFYRCLREEPKLKRLLARLELVCHSREEFVWCHDTWENCEDDVERAARWYYMIRMSFAQLGRNFARSTGSLPQQCSAYFNSFPEFWEIHRILKTQRWQIENLDAIQCINDYDSPETVHYIDPDYIGTNKCYKHGVNHSLLMETIKNGKGFFAVSGYANDLYDKQDFWTDRLTWDVYVSITSQAFDGDPKLADKKYVMTREKKATEVLWIKENQ